jgi:WD40 repeat protein
VTSVAVSPDGRFLASGSGRVRLYDLHTGKLLLTIGADPSRGVNGLAFSPDGSLVTTAGLEMDHTVKVWDTRTGALAKALAGHEVVGGNLYTEGYAVAFSPDGRLLASADRDKVVLVWDVGTWTLRHRLAGHEDAAASLAFSPDGRTLASGGADRSVRLWDVASGKLQRTLRGHAHRVNAVAFTPDGRTLASAGGPWARFGHAVPAGECQVKLWDTATWSETHSLREHGRYSSLAFAPDGRRLAWGVADAVRLYDVTTGRPEGVAFTHDGGVTSVASTPDGREVISGSYDRTVAVVPVPGPTPRLRLPGYWEAVKAVAVSPDGTRIAGGSGDLRFFDGRRRAGDPVLTPGKVRLWDARTGRLLLSLGGPAEQVRAVAFSPDGRGVVSGGGGADGAGVVRLWDAQTGASVWAQADPRGVAFAVAVAPDGRMLASASTDGSIQLRDVTTGAVRHAWAGHEGAATAVTFAADGRTLVSGGADQCVRFWDVPTSRPGRVLRAAAFRPAKILGKEEGVITAVALSPDGGLIAMCGCSEAPGIGNSLVRVWDARTGELKHTLERDQARGRFVAFSPDGATLASNGTGKSIALWDVRTGQFLRQLVGHPHPPHSAAFTPDGRSLVSGADYREVKIWDTTSARLRATLKTFAEGRDAPATGEWLAYTPDDDYDGSPGVERLLRWRLGDGSLTAELPGAPGRRADRLFESLQGKR